MGLTGDSWFKMKKLHFDFVDMQLNKHEMTVYFLETKNLIFTLLFLRKANL